MQCEHVLDSTMLPFGLESESESVSGNVNEPLHVLVSVARNHPRLTNNTRSKICTFIYSAT